MSHALIQLLAVVAPLCADPSAEPTVIQAAAVEQIQAEAVADGGYEMDLSEICSVLVEGG